MTELEHYEPPRATTGLQVWADEAAAAEQIAHRLAATPFVPASLRVFYRGEPDIGATTANITAALLTGQELGLSPMSSLRSIDIVNGTPALRAIALRALVQAAGHDVWQVESTATRAIFRGRRAGAPNEQTQESNWTMDRARSLGLAGKDNWRKQPTAMLAARATAEICRLVASDAILGLAYSAEELEDGPDAPVVAIETAKPAERRTARRKTIAAAPVEPEPDEPELVEQSPPAPPPDPEPEPEPESATETPPPRSDAQLRHIIARFGDLGITDRKERLWTCSQLLGRELASANDLTFAEARTLLDALVPLADRDALETLLRASGADSYPPPEPGPAPSRDAGPNFPADEPELFEDGKA